MPAIPDNEDLRPPFFVNGNPGASGRDRRFSLKVHICGVATGNRILLLA